MGGTVRQEIVLADGVAVRDVSRAFAASVRPHLRGKNTTSNPDFIALSASIRFMVL